MWIRGSETHEWLRLCQAIEREDLEHDPRFESLKDRLENHTALFNIIEETFRARTLDEWRVRLNEAGVIWAPLQSLPAVIADPQSRANDLFVAYNHPTHGPIEVVANPVKLGKTQATIRTPEPKPSQHTEEVLLEYGYSRKDIEQLKEQGVVA